jgi:hypothetical protein
MELAGRFAFYKTDDRTVFGITREMPFCNLGTKSRAEEFLEKSRFPGVHISWRRR